MGRAGSSFFTVPDQRRPSWAGPEEAAPTIIWLRGEHDIATDGELALTMARAIALNDAAIVLDLSDVELLSASTIGVIVAAREFLDQRSRSLRLRYAPAFVARILRICQLDDLLAPSREWSLGDDMRKVAACGGP